MTYKERPIFVIDPEHRFKLDPGFIEEYRGREPAWGPVGKVAFVRTYAWEVESEGRVEEYWETCRRVVEGIWSIFKQVVNTAFNPWDEAEAQGKAQEMFRRMWVFKWLPPGRGLQFMGTRALELKGGAILNNCGFVSTADIQHHFAEPFCALMDFLMLGVGMGYDVRGAGTFIVEEPVRGARPYVVDDRREGWVGALRTLLNAYAGAGELPSAFDFSRVRPEGAKLRTFGGTASGPAPLERLLVAVRKVLDARIGLPITTTDIVDIANHIGACVVAGNIRRSAEIAIGEADDLEFLRLKDPTELRALERAQSARACEVHGVATLDAQILTWRKEQTGKSVLDPAYSSAQDQIDRLSQERASLLRADSEWAELQARIDAHPLYTHRWASNNTVLCSPGQNFAALAKQTVENGEPGYGFLDNIRAYGRMCDARPTLPPETEWKDAHVKGWNPCGEQPLEDNELCCLVEVNPNAHDTLEDFLVTLKYAYMYAKGVTLVPTHRPATNAIITRNRRIGTSLMGVFKMYERLGMSECIRWWDAGYRELCKWDRTYAHWLGVPESIKKTTIKPGGTTPLLVGEEGGMKLTLSEYYFRTVRIEETSPIVSACREAGYLVEKDRYSARTSVVYFPVHAPGVRTAERVTLWEQAELLAALQAYWSDNMVSNTLTFLPQEAPDVERVLNAFAHRIKGTSFLPLSTHGYAQAPYIPITEQEYHAAVAKLRPLVLSNARHEVDEKYCTGEVCSIS